MKYNELHRKLKKAGCYPTGNVFLRVKYLFKNIVNYLVI